MNPHISAPLKVVRPLDKDQREFLSSQLRDLKYSRRRRRPQDPPSIRNMRARVNAYDKRVRKEDERAEARFEKACDKVREEMLFGDVRKALVILRKLKGKS